MGWLVKMTQLMCSDVFAKVIKWYGAKGDEKDKLVQELKEMTFPLKLETLQKNVTNGHVNGSETLLWPDFHCCCILSCILDMLSQHLTWLTALSLRKSMLVLWLNQTLRSGWRRGQKQITETQFKASCVLTDILTLNIMCCVVMNVSIRNYVIILVILNNVLS